MKVSIVCGSPTTEFLAPFHDERQEIWVLGNRYDRFIDKRVTRIFEIHEDLSEHDKAYPKWLVDFKIPLVVGEKFPIKARHVEVFPYEKIYKLDPDGVSLASSSAYMMALAILEGAEEISIYGVDMAVDDHEYFWQRPCMWGWVKFARGKGIKVNIPKESALCRMSYEEGRDWVGGKKQDKLSQFALKPFTSEAFKEVAKTHADNIEKIKKEIEIMQAHIQTHEGARQAYERMAKISRAVEAGQENLTLSGNISIKN